MKIAKILVFEANKITPSRGFWKKVMIKGIKTGPQPSIRQKKSEKTPILSYRKATAMCVSQ